MVASRGGPKSAAAAAATATATAVTSASAETSAGTVRLVVQVQADGATLSLDDEPRALPYQGKMPRGTSVRLSARAPGFVDYDRALTLDEDTNLDIALSRAPLGAGSAPSPSASAASVRTGTADDRAKSRKKRAIDDGDPYRR
jgi:hypothetical protein